MMTQILIQNLKKSFGEKEVLSGIHLHLESGERVGLVGANGCGKSTLLQILEGSMEPDEGVIQRASSENAVLLRQAPELSERLLRRWQTDSAGEFWQTLSELGANPEQLNRPVPIFSEGDMLSGGEHMKLALAGVLAQKPSLLLLDEPTNNLDFAGITALIDLINSFDGTLVVVSHDRYFLDCTVSRILELEEGTITEYFGNYTDYREEKERLYQERLHRWESDKKQQQQVEQAIRQLKDWSSKAHRDSTKADSSGNKAGVKEYKRAKAKRMDQQIKSQLKRLEKMKKESEARPRQEQNVYFSIQSEGRRGKRLIEAEGLCKGYGSRTLFEKSDFVILRGERVALFGPNGCGKTTLVRMLEGREEPDQGRLWVSPSAEPFVLSQNPQDLPAEKTPLQFFQSLWGGLDGEQRILLANMGLSARHLNQRISTLSLGERMKIKLAEPVLARRPFIILDEPTNYLDLHSREMLEDTLASYEGTLLLVSHDVYFLERVCDKVLLFDPESRTLKKLELSFRDYLSRRKS